MSRPIRVDPGQFRASAERLSALAAKLSLLESQTLESATAAPSYEGQFGPQVNALATEAASQIRSMVARLDASARRLQAIAELFENADRQTIDAIEGIGSRFGPEIERYLALLAQPSPLASASQQLGLDLTLAEFQAMSAAERLA